MAIACVWRRALKIKSVDSWSSADALLIDVGLSVIKNLVDDGVQTESHFAVWLL